MGGMASTLQLGLAYCCCNASSSLCNTCLGSTSASSTGRKRSVLLLSITITLALFFQYVLAPSVITQTGWWKIYSSIPGMGKVMYHSWTDSCLVYNENNNNDGNGNNDSNNTYSDLYKQCVANAAVFRPTFIATLFFLISAIATKTNPTLNKKGWPSKFGVYFILITITLFIPNNPLFTPLFLILLRIGAMIFIFIQQIILIDIAYNWNETLVYKADEADNEEWGSGQNWLRLIIIFAMLLYAASFTGIVLLYKFFSGCVENTIVITLTLLQIITMTVIQLFFSDGEGSTLTTSVLSVYATYLGYSIVSKNPNYVCNPTLGSDDVSSIVIGLCLTMLSLAWTGWSWTAESRIDNVNNLETTTSLNGNVGIGNGSGVEITNRLSQSANLNLDVPFLDPDDQPTTGVVMQGSNNVEEDGNDVIMSTNASSSLWKLNVVLALISCWVAASLTGWGSISGGIGEGGEHTAANPLVGRLNMAMIAVSQNIAILLYLWTLVAPTLFPDREFS